MIFSQISAKLYAIFQIFVSVTYTNGYDCQTAAESFQSYESGDAVFEVPLVSKDNFSKILRCQLFSNYNSSISPNASSQDYLQMLDLGIFYADIDVSGILQLIGEAKAIWQDKQLMWKPSEYNNIDSLDIQNNFYQIWKPDFILINNVFRENRSLLGSNDYVTTVMHNGTVTFWTRYISIQAKCPITIQRRPWLDHTCQLHFKTSSPNFVFTIHNGSESTSSQVFNNSTRVNSDIESPWTVNKTQKVQPADVNNKSSDNSILIEVELHRNMGPYKSTRCISYPRSHEDALRCYLFSNFDLLSPPSEALSPSHTMVYPPVMTWMRISYIDFNIEDGILLLIGHFSAFWEDQRILNWDLNKFGRLLYVDLKPNSVWKPTLQLNNHLFREDYKNNETFANDYSVKARWFGNFIWKTSIYLHTKCDMSGSHSWPWDYQKCSLNFTTNTIAMDFDAYYQENEKNGGGKSLWRITNITKQFDFPNLNLVISFKMKSHSPQVVSGLTFVVVSLVMLASFWISPSSKIKLPSKISSLLLLVIYMIMLINSIPNFTTIAHNFLIGYVMLLLIVGISSCITAYVVRLARKSRPYHPSLIMGVTNLEEIKCENDISTDDESPTEESPSKKSPNEWLKIAMMIEYSSFAICLLVDLCLTVSFMT